MKVSLSGLLKNLADEIDRLTKGKGDRWGCAFQARETAKHCQETAAGQHTIEEFADFYCLAPERKPAPLTETEYCPLG